MVEIPGGVFLMGSDEHYAEEAPVHRVAVGAFWMDAHTVTNKEFRRFVEATGHVTLAEKPANPDDYPARSPKCSRRRQCCSERPRPRRYAQPVRATSGSVASFG